MMLVRVQFALALLGVMALVFGGCERFPEDPERTLARALERGALRVGVTESAPWVTRQDGGGAGGLEGRLVAEFAAQLGVQVEWRWGPAERHFEALERYELDIVAGELTQQNPWKKRVGLSIPYYTSRTVVGVRPPAAAEIDLEGVTVATPPGSGLTRKLADRGATVVEREDLASAAGPIAAELWEVERAGFRATEVQLGKRRHVFAVPPGENAMLMRLETFLLERGDEDHLRSVLREAQRQ